MPLLLVLSQPLVAAESGITQASPQTKGLATRNSAGPKPKASPRVSKPRSVLRTDSQFVPVFPPCSPQSDFSLKLTTGEPSPQFCAQWNPDFSFNGHRCCGKYVIGGLKLRQNNCAPHRKHSNFCAEITEQQKEYTEAAVSGRLGDLLTLITQEIGIKGDQALCTVNNGFLANGRRLIPTVQNRIKIRSPERCTNFGTDGMIAMLEWFGREVQKQYSDSQYQGVHLIVGDISGPRGGCMFGRSGRRGHASHTNGQDADVGFLSARPNLESPVQFHQQFDVKANWWALKKIFKNPFACIKVIFLDRQHIRSLNKYAQKDSDWKSLNRFIRHMPGHKNHFHIRIGNGPGLAGCIPDAKPELEFEEDDLTEPEGEQSIMPLSLPSVKN